MSGSLQLRGEKDRGLCDAFVVKNQKPVRLCQMLIPAFFCSLNVHLLMILPV